MIENLIKRNQQKIFLLCAIFTMWCFYTVVKDGGAVIPRIEKLEGLVEHEHNHYEHTHIYSTGAAKWEK